jgi:hypothetical protein
LIASGSRLAAEAARLKKLRTRRGVNVSGIGSFTAASIITRADGVKPRNLADLRASRSW